MTQAIINKNKRDNLDPMQRFDWNVVKLSSGNTTWHEKTKQKIGDRLNELNRVFLSEIRLNNGDRPDILIMDCFPPIAIEVMKSEKQESIERKKKSYYPIKILTFPNQAKEIEEQLQVKI